LALDVMGEFARAGKNPGLIAQGKNILLLGK